MPDEERLTMDQIAQLGEEQQGPKKQEPLAERVLPFTLKVTMENGQVLEGDCEFTVPDRTTRLKIGRVKARLAGGIPWECLDPETRLLIEATSVVQFYLTKRPVWLNKILDSGDRDDVLYQLYTAARDHEDKFFRRLGGEGGQGSRTPMVQLVPRPGASDPPADFRLELRDPLPGRTVGRTGSGASQRT